MKSGRERIREAVAAAEEAVPKGAEGDRRLAGKLCNDSGNAERLRARSGKDLLYVPQLGRLAWSGTHWSAPDGEKQWALAARQASLKIWDELAALREELGEDEPKKLKALAEWALDSGNRSRLAAMQALAEPLLQHQVGELDAAPFLFNCANGTLELGSNKDAAAIRLRRHARLDLITRLSPARYEAEAECPRFRRFLDEIMPDDAIQEWLQRWFGYCLTADFSEARLACFWGEGRNGKGVLMKLMLWLFGDYGASLEFASLLSDDRRRGSEPSPDLAALQGARAVFAGEPKKNARLDDGRIKAITGGDVMKVRHLNREFFDLRPTFKLTLAFNNKPVIKDDTHAMWSRVCLVPFEVVIAEEKIDRGLIDALKEEASGVLNWALDGFRRWRETGLSPPQAIVAATAEYRSESDEIGQFLERAFERHPPGKIRTADIYGCYLGWAKAMDKRPVSRTKFGIELTKRWLSGFQDEGGRTSRTGLRWRLDIDWPWEPFMN